MPPSCRRGFINTLVAAAPISILYRYWLITPVLKYLSINQWCSISVLRQHSCGISKRRRRPHKEAKTKLLLRQEFSIQKKYRLVALSRTTPVNAGNRSQTPSASATFSVSAVGFIVHNGGTIGGSSTFHLLRKTSRGWQEDTEIPKCGRIY